jgi:translation elongation factor EF-Tu-like GTPase
MKKTVLFAIAIVISISGALPVFSQAVQVTKLDDRVKIEINGKLFTEYWFKGDQHPAITESKTSDGKTSKKQSCKTRYITLLLVLAALR